MSQESSSIHSGYSQSTKQDSVSIESDSLSSSSESLKQLTKYEWEQYWSDKRQSHRTRDHDSDCECGSDEDDIFELEDLDRRIRRLKNQLKKDLARIGQTQDDYISGNEDDYQYIGLDVIMNEESEWRSRLHEMRSLQRRSRALRKQIHKRKRMRASNPRKVRMHEARVTIHEMRAPLRADEQEWKKILDDLEDDIEADEQRVITQQSPSILSAISDTGPDNYQEHLSLLSPPVQLFDSDQYNRDQELNRTFYITSGVDSLSQIDDDAETEHEQSPKPLLVLERRRIVIIFLTSNKRDAELLILSKQLNQTADNIIIFDNAVDCFNYLATTTNCIVAVIVIDDYASNQHILTMLNESPPVSIIYRRIGGQDQRPLIYEQDLMDVCPKLQGSFTEINPLRQRINADLTIAQDTFNVFSPYDIERSIRDLKTEDITFVWYQIMIDLIQLLPVTAETRADFLAECRKAYDVADPIRKQIDEFEMTYQSAEACNWYTRPLFLFKIINEALRKQNVTTIYNLRLFIKDLSTQLMTKCDANTNLITVYRSQSIGNEEIAKLQGKDGGLIAFNTFLSTSRNILVAKMFSGVDNALDSDPHSYLTMEIEATTDMCRSLKDISQIPDEDEYLFKIGTIFKIVSFELKSPKSYYAKLSYITDTDRLRLNVVKKHFEQRISLGQGPYDLAWGRLLYHIGDYNAAKEYYERLQNGLTDTHFELAIAIQNDLAQICFRQGLYMEANDFQQQALDQALASPVPLNMSIFHENQGNILLKLNKHAHALDAYRRALDIEQRRQPSKEKNIARIYSNMGIAHNILRQYALALSCFRRAFKIQRRITLANSTDLAATCNNIGIVYTNIGEHKLAHKYYSKAFSIALRSLPHDHPSVQMYLQNRDAYLTATPMHDSKKPVLVGIPHRRRRDSDVSIPQIEIILDPSTS